MPSRWRRAYAVVVMLVGLALATCASPAPTPLMRVEAAWARPAAMSETMPRPEESMRLRSSTKAMQEAGQGGMMSSAQGMGATSAVYLTLRNDGSAADRLIAVRTDVAGKAEVHQTTVEGGIARMQPVSAVDVPAGSRTDLKPGGLHIMLMDLRQNLQVSDRFRLTLQFERSGDLTVEAEVRAP